MQPLGMTKGITPTGLFVIIWLTVGFAILFTLVRTVIRMHIFGRIYADDLFVYLALAVLLSIAVLYNYVTPIMFEFDAIVRGTKKLSPGFDGRLKMFLRLQFAIIVLFWTCIWTVKLSFLIWYRKMMDVPTNRKIPWNAVTIFTIASYLGCWVTQLEACRPISHYFVSGLCESKRDIFASNLSLYYSAAVDIICDLLIMALPLKVLLRLQITRRQKLALGTLFCLVFISIAFAIVRVVQTRASAEHVNPIWLAVWSMIEASVAVIVSCLPSFHVLLISRSSSYRRRHQAPNFQQRDHDAEHPKVLDKKVAGSIDQEITGIIEGHDVETDSEEPTTPQKAKMDDGLGKVLPGIPNENVYSREGRDYHSSEQKSDDMPTRDEKCMVVEV